MIKCKICNTETYNIKFCSRKCQTEGKKQIRKKQVSYKCKICDTEIICTEAKSKTKKYCSIKCQHESYKHNKVERIEISCMYCAKNFLIRKKMSQNGKAKYCSRDCKDNHQKELYVGVNNPAYGKLKSHLQKIVCSERTKKMWEESEFREWFKKKSEEYYKAHGHFYGADEKSKQKRKETNTKKFLVDHVWKDKEIRQKCEDTTFERYGEYSLDLARKALLGQKTKIEKIIEKILIDNNLKYEIQHRVYINDSEYRVYDFYLVDFNLLVEADGNFWHANPEEYDKKKLHAIQKINLKNDKLKNELAERMNFGLLRFWESDIKQDYFDLYFLQKINKWAKNI